MIAIMTESLAKNFEGYVWVVPCPLCKCERELKFEKLYYERNLCSVMECRYVCEKCETIITDDAEQLKKMGRWVLAMHTPSNMHQIAITRSLSGLSR